MKGELTVEEITKMLEKIWKHNPPEIRIYHGPMGKEPDTAYTAFSASFISPKLSSGERSVNMTTGLGGLQLMIKNHPEVWHLSTIVYNGKELTDELKAELFKDLTNEPA